MRPKNKLIGAAFTKFLNRELKMIVTTRQSNNMTNKQSRDSRQQIQIKKECTARTPASSVYYNIRNFGLRKKKELRNQLSAEIKEYQNTFPRNKRKRDQTDITSGGHKKIRQL
jgi:hypothetical protein